MSLPPTILVMDDNAKCRHSLCDGLAAKGYSLAAAHDGVQGLEAVGRLAPDLVICDLTLPGRSGLRVLEQIKTSPRPIPVIIHSSVDGSALRSLAFLLGASEFFRKPVSLNRLLEVVDRLCLPSTAGLPTPPSTQSEAALAHAAS